MRTKFLKFSVFSYLKLKSFFLKNGKRTVLISNKQDWKPTIEKGFRFSKHTIKFVELTPDVFEGDEVIVPITIEDLLLCNDFRNKIIDNPVPIPKKESLLLCDDKYKFSKKLFDDGFGDYLPQIGTSLDLPYILKKKVGGNGEDIFIINDEQEEKGINNLLNDPDYFCQEIIAGRTEYATHILFKNNKIVSWLNIKYEFDKEYPIKGLDKDKPVAMIPTTCPYLDLFSEILEKIEFEGICCFNYKMKNNIPMIFEINPRIGGSLIPYLFSFVEKALC